MNSQMDGNFFEISLAQVLSEAIDTPNWANCCRANLCGRRIQDLSQKTINEGLEQAVEKAKIKGIHVLLVTFEADNTALTPILFERCLTLGFRVYEHNSKYEALTMFQCLFKSNLEHECRFPPAKQLSIGVTGVIVDSEGNMIAVEEKCGSNAWKALTGGLDLKSQESPLECVLREAKEEVDIGNITQLKLAGLAWTPRMFEDRPDLNLIFVGKAPFQAPLIPEKAEIRKAEWLSTAEVSQIKPDSVESRAIQAAVEVVKNGGGFDTTTAYWRWDKDKKTPSTLFLPSSS